MSNSPKFTREIFLWLSAVNADRELPSSATKVAVVLASAFNEERDGMAWVSLQTIAAAAAMSKANAIKLVSRLEACGHLRVQWGSRGSGKSNNYWMQKRSPQSDLSEQEKGHSGPRKRSLQSEKRSLASDLNLLNPSKEEPPKQQPRAREELDSKQGNKARNNNSVNGASASLVETDEERMRRWWAMVGDWVQHDEAGWPFRDWGPRPGDYDCQIPDSVLMEWLISLESPRTSWHVKNALRLLEQSYLTARPRDVKEGAA